MRGKRDYEISLSRWIYFTDANSLQGWKGKDILKQGYKHWHCIRIFSHLYMCLQWLCLATDNMSNCIQVKFTSLNGCIFSWVKPKVWAHLWVHTLYIYWDDSFIRGCTAENSPRSKGWDSFFLLQIIKLSQHFFFLSFCFLLKSYPFPGSVLGPFMENRWLTTCKWVYSWLYILFHWFVCLALLVLLLTLQKVLKSNSVSSNSFSSNYFLLL